MGLKIERIDTDTFKIEGEIKIEFSMVEKAFRLMESLNRELSEHKDYLKAITKTPQKTKSSGTHKRFLSVQETAQYLGISPSTIYNRISRRSEYPFPLRPKRIGRRVRFDIEDLNKYMDAL